MNMQVSNRFGLLVGAPSVLYRQHKNLCNF